MRVEEAIIAMMIRSAAIGCMCALVVGCDLEQNPVSETDSRSVFDKDRKSVV